MARNKGLLGISANFEPQIAAPLDGRANVPTKADLTGSSNWVANDGISYAYDGMTVTVAEDSVSSNNGVYILTDAPNVTDINSWIFLGSSATGSLMVTGSVSQNVLTFEKGDGTTFNLTVETGSSLTVTSSNANATHYLALTDATSSVNTLYVDDNKLIYNPFTNTLTTENIIVNGDLIVEGTRTELRVSELNVEDKLVVIASGSISSAASDGAGIFISGANVGLTWNDSNSALAVGTNLQVDNVATDTTIDDILVLDPVTNVIKKRALSSAVDTGSFYYSSSVSDDTVTFNQGDGTTESVTIDNVENATSASYAPNLYNSDGTITETVRDVTMPLNTVLTFIQDSGSRFVINTTAGGANPSSFKVRGTGATIIETENVSLTGIPSGSQLQVVGIDPISRKLSRMNASSINSIDTGSFYISSSVSLNTITFTQGDGTTESVTVDTGSSVTVDTGSFYISSSVNLNTITFTQGDGTTESVTVDTGSAVVVNTGSFYISSSVNLNTITFTQGDGTTETVTVDTGSAVPIDTGSFYISSSVSDATVTFTQGDGTTESVTIDNVENATSASYAPNLYNTDGTLTDARVVTSNGNNLTFDMTTADFVINSDPSQSVIIHSLPTGDNPQVLGVDVNGVIRAMNTSSIAGSAIDTGSFYVSSSVNLNTIIFTQGDGTTESVTVDTGSAVATDTGSFMITGSATSNILTFTKGDGTTFDLTVDTGSFLYSGSFDSGSSDMTLYSADTNYTLDLSGLIGSGDLQTVTDAGNITTNLIEIAELISNGSATITGSIGRNTLTLEQNPAAPGFPILVINSANTNQNSTSIAAVNSDSEKTFTVFNDGVVATYGPGGNYLNVVLGEKTRGTDSGITNSVLIGYSAGENNTQSQLTAVGTYAGQNNTGTSLSAFGTSTGQNNTGTAATSIGAFAGMYNAGDNTIYVGSAAGRYSSGSYNIGIGYNAADRSNGEANIGIGREAGRYSNGNNGVGIGYYTLYFNSGSNNTAIGELAASENTVLTGDKNTFLGSNASYGTAGSITNATAVGADVTLAESNTVILGNNANVGIGTSTPGAVFHVTGSISGSGNVHFDSLPSASRPNVVGFDTTTGQLSYFSTGSFGGDSIDTGSLLVTSSLSGNIMTFEKGDSSTYDLDLTTLFVNDALNTSITIKNVSSGAITKGTPCYITASGTSGNLVGVIPADAGDPNLMPAGVIAAEDLTNVGDEGIGYINGWINGVNTSAFASGDNIYIAVGGGYTNVKPTGSALIQKLGNVEKVHASNGSGVIVGAGRANDVPNISPGYAWVGNSDHVATPVATSSFKTNPDTPLNSFQFNSSSAFGGSEMYYDETNQRVGINISTPQADLHVRGANNGTGSILLETDSLGVDEEAFAALYFRVSDNDGADYKKFAIIAENTGTDFGYGRLHFALDDNTNNAANANIADSKLIIDHTGSVFMPDLSNVSKPNVIGFDTATGKLTYYSTGSLGGGTTSPGGADTQVQFNDGGVLGGDANFTWNKTSNVLSIKSNISSPALQLYSAMPTNAANLSLGELSFYSETAASDVGAIILKSEAAWSNGDVPTRLEFQTTPDGTETPTTKLTIKENGRVGIGVISPTNGFFEVSGDVSGTSIYASHNIVAYSDARSKTNVTTIDNALDKVDAIRGVTYNKVEDPDGIRYMGVIAQELQDVLPEVVAEGEDGHLAVAYGNIVGVLIEAVKELRAEIKELKEGK